MRKFLLFTLLFCSTLVWAQPANDECANATLLVSATSSIPVFTASSSSNGTQSLAACQGTANADVWYTFTATSAIQLVYVQHNFGPTNAVVQIFSGDCAGLTSLFCGNFGLNSNYPNTTVIQQNGLTVGQTYYFRVYYSGTTNSNFGVAVTQPPANNECAQAEILPLPTAGVSAFFEGNLLGATTSLPVTTCVFNAGSDVWYSFTAGAVTHAVDVLRLSTGAIQLYRGNCGALVAEPCNDYRENIGDTLRIFMENLAPGQTYYFKFLNTNNFSTGRYRIGISTPTLAVNDRCENATSLIHSGNSCTPQLISFKGALPNGGAATGTCISSSNVDIWYQFTATSARLAAIFKQEGSNNWVKRMALYRGGCANLQRVVCPAADSFAVGGLTIGETYYLQVSKSGGFLSDNIGNLCLYIPNTVPNDECAGAINLPVQETELCNYQFFSTANASFSSGFTPLLSPSLPSTNNDVFFKFTATETSTIVAITTEVGGGSYAIFTGNCNSPVLLSGPQLILSDSKFTLSTVVGQVYYIMFSSSTPVFAGFCISKIVNPANKTCAGAVPVAVATRADLAMPVRINIGNGVISIPSCPFGYSTDVWFSFKASSDSVAMVLTGNGITYGWQLLSGTCGNTTSIRCSTVSATTGWSPLVLDGLTAGTDYFLRIQSGAGLLPEKFQNFLFLYNAKKGSNNYCAQATNLTVQPSTGYNLVSGNLSGNYNEVSGCTITGQAWYRFTATATTHPMIIRGNLFPVIGLFTGNCGSLTLIPGTCVGASDVGRDVRNLTGLTVGTTYYIRVASSATNAQNGNFGIAVLQQALVTNDDCATPIVLPIRQQADVSNLPYYSLRGATASAPGSSPEGTCINFATVADVWYSFSGNGKTVNIASDMVLAQHRMYLYTGNCGSLTFVSCTNDDNILSLTTVAGEVYRIRVAQRFPSQFPEYTIRVYEQLELTSNVLVNPSCLSTNLVRNPGFDTLASVGNCPPGFVNQPSNILNFSYNLLRVQNWNMPTHATTDIFASCSGNSSSVNPLFNICTGYESPRSGGNYAGIIAHITNNNYNEYLQGTLASPLQPGKSYLFSFNISLSDYSLIGIDRLGVYFSDTKTAVPIQGVLSVVPQFETAGGTFYTGKQGWTTISFLYTPTEAMEYFTIGNFRHHLQTKVVPTPDDAGRNAGGAFVGCANLNALPAAYYFIDDVSMSEVTGTNCLLAITDLKWNATAVNKDVAIKWTYPASDNIAQFIIEHSTDGQRFNRINLVNATGQKDHTYQHLQPGTGKQFYRMVLLYKDGEKEYSSIKQVTIGGLSAPTVSPTLTTGTLWIRNAGAGALVKIVNISGGVLLSKTIQDQDMLSIGSWAKGMYFVMIEKKDGTRFTSKVILN